MCQELEAKLSIELKSFSLDPEHEVETPFKSHLKNLMRASSKAIINEELNEILGADEDQINNAAGGLASAKRRQSLLSGHNGGNKGINLSEVEELFSRMLSEKGIIVSMITVKDLVEKFARHETKVDDLREMLDT